MTNILKQQPTCSQSPLCDEDSCSCEKWGKDQIEEFDRVYHNPNTQKIIYRIVTNLVEKFKNHPNHKKI